LNQYPVVNFIVKHGAIVAIAIGILPLLGAIACVVIFAGHAFLIVAGAVASVVLFFLMKSYVEVVQLMADMLLPK
jgi:hypothetical protein